MIIGIDASNIRAGGGLTHLVEILSVSSPRLNNFSKIVIWGGEGTLCKIIDKPWISKKSFKLFELGFIARVLWQIMYLPILLKHEKWDLLFVPGGIYLGRFRPVVIMSQNLLPFDNEVLSLLSNYILKAKMFLVRFAQIYSFENADGIIFVSDYSKIRIMDIIKKTNAVVATIYHGVNRSFNISQGADKKQKNDGPFKILYVSTVEMYKYQWNVVQAVGILRRRGLPVILDIVGGGSRKAIKKLKSSIVSNDENGDYITYSGSVPHKEIGKKYNDSDIFVFASTCETFGMVLTEAMASGLPIASSNRSSMPEILGDASLYFNPTNHEEIANVIQEYVQSKDMRIHYSEASLRRIRIFSWVKCSKETFTFLNQIIITRNSKKYV